MWLGLVLLILMDSFGLFGLRLGEFKNTTGTERVNYISSPIEGIDLGFVGRLGLLFNDYHMNKRIVINFLSLWCLVVSQTAVNQTNRLTQPMFEYS